MAKIKMNTLFKNNYLYTSNMVIVFGIKQNIFSAWLLLILFVSSGIIVSAHNIDADFHKHCHHNNEDHDNGCCSICMFMVTPYESSSTIAAPAIFFFTFPAHALIYNSVILSSHNILSFFLRGPPAIFKQLSDILL